MTKVPSAFLSIKSHCAIYVKFLCLEGKMAVSSLSRDFRKIDIEQYADDFYVDDEPDNSLAGPDEMAVQSAINGGQQQVSICLVSLFIIFQERFGPCTRKLPCCI